MKGCGGRRPADSPPRPRHSSGLALLAVAAILGLAGCGSEPDPTATAVPRGYEVVHLGSTGTCPERLANPGGVVVETGRPPPLRLGQSVVPASPDQATICRYVGFQLTGHASLRRAQPLGQVEAAIAAFSRRVSVSPSVNCPSLPVRPQTFVLSFGYPDGRALGVYFGDRCDDAIDNGEGWWIPPTPRYATAEARLTDVLESATGP